MDDYTHSSLSAPEMAFRALPAIIALVLLFIASWQSTPDVPCNGAETSTRHDASASPRVTARSHERDHRASRCPG